MKLSRAATGLLLGLSLGCGILIAEPTRQGDDWAMRAEILARIIPPQFPDRDFPVTDFGAVGNGRHDNHPAFRDAIAACHAAGGGRVVVPRGWYLLNGPIHLASQVNLHLEAGATVTFAAEPDYFLPLVLTRWEGTMLFGHSPRIYARQATNIAITGSGTIDGNGRATLAFMKGKPRASSGTPRRMGAEGTPIEEREFGPEQWLRPSMIQFMECENILIEGVTLRDSTFWVVHPVLSRNITARGLVIESWNSNNDGVDPDSCRDVLIEHCEFRTGDDAIAIKSGRDQDGWKVGRPSENIVIRHNLMGSRHAGVCIGSEMSGGVRNVFIEDCQMEAVSSALYFKANLDRGGTVEHVRARNIKVDRVREGLVWFETDYGGYRGGQFPPTFRDYVLEDLHCEEAIGYGIQIEGDESSIIRDVVIRRARIERARDPLLVRHAEAIVLEDVIVNGQALTTPAPDKT